MIIPADLVRIIKGKVTTVKNRSIKRNEWLMKLLLFILCFFLSAHTAESSALNLDSITPRTITFLLEIMRRKNTSYDDTNLNNFYATLLQALYEAASNNQPLKDEIYLNERVPIYIRPYCKDILQEDNRLYPDAQKIIQGTWDSKLKNLNQERLMALENAWNPKKEAPEEEFPLSECTLPSLNNSSLVRRREVKKTGKK